MNIECGVLLLTLLTVISCLFFCFGSHPNPARAMRVQHRAVCCVCWVHPSFSPRFPRAGSHVRADKTSRATGWGETRHWGSPLLFGVREAQLLEECLLPPLAGSASVIPAPNPLRCAQTQQPDPDPSSSRQKSQFYLPALDRLSSLLAPISTKLVLSRRHSHVSTTCWAVLNVGAPPRLRCHLAP